MITISDILDTNNNTIIIDNDSSDTASLVSAVSNKISSLAGGSASVNNVILKQIIENAINNSISTVNANIATELNTTIGTNGDDSSDTSINLDSDYIYTNTATGENISSSDVIDVSEAGMVINYHNTHQLITWENILSQYNETSSELSIDSAKSINQETYYNYFFGINFKFGYGDIQKDTYGFISDAIDNIKSGDTIKLKVNDYTNDYSSIEYYILDGGNEVPVLPEGVSYITNEKRFADLDTRFMIDTTQEYIINDNQISYYPITEPSYTVQNGNIRIKVIMRLYDISKGIAEINSIIIKKKAGE